MKQIMNDPRLNTFKQNRQSPQSFFNSLLDLPRQYCDVLLKPSVTSLSLLGKQATWTIVMLQFFVLMLLVVLMNTLAIFIPHAVLHSITAFHFNGTSLFSLLPAPLNGLTIILVSFFIGLFTAYLFSKLCGGRGTLVAHAHILLVCTIPLITISGLLLLLPALGSLAVLSLSIVGGLFAYRLVLHTLTILAIHDLPTWQASLIVLIIPMILVLLGLIILSKGEVLGSLCEGFDLSELRRKKTNPPA